MDLIVSVPVFAYLLFNKQKPFLNIIIRLNVSLYQHSASVLPHNSLYLVKSGMDGLGWKFT